MNQQSKKIRQNILSRCRQKEHKSQDGLANRQFEKRVQSILTQCRKRNARTRARWRIDSSRKTPEYTGPVATKGTQEPGHVGESAIQLELPEYKVLEEKKEHKSQDELENRRSEKRVQSIQSQYRQKEHKNQDVLAKSVVREELRIQRTTSDKRNTRTRACRRISGYREESPEYTNPFETKERKNQDTRENQQFAKKLQNILSH